MEENVRRKTAVFDSRQDYDVARERGRALAANSIATNPEARAAVEAKYGVEKCMIQYPEAYGLDQEPRIVLP